MPFVSSVVANFPFNVKTSMSNKKAQESPFSTTEAQSSLTETSPEWQQSEGNNSQPVKKLVSKKQSLLRVFLLTATCSALIGASCGFAFRLVIASKFRSSLFHAEQSFPPSENWPGTIPPQEFSDASTLYHSIPPSQELLSQPLPETQELPHDSEFNPQQQLPASENTFIPPANETTNPDSAYNNTEEATIFSESEILPLNQPR